MDTFKICYTLLYDVRYTQSKLKLSFYEKNRLRKIQAVLGDISSTAENEKETQEIQEIMSIIRSYNTTQHGGSFFPFLYGIFEKNKSTVNTSDNKEPQKRLKKTVDTIVNDENKSPEQKIMDLEGILKKKQKLLNEMQNNRSKLDKDKDTYTQRYNRTNNNIDYTNKALHKLKGKEEENKKENKKKEENMLTTSEEKTSTTSEEKTPTTSEEKTSTTSEEKTSTISDVLVKLDNQKENKKEWEERIERAYNIEACFESLNTFDKEKTLPGKGHLVKLLDKLVQSCALDPLWKALLQGKFQFTNEQKKSECEKKNKTEEDRNKIKCDWNNIRKECFSTGDLTENSLELRKFDQFNEENTKEEVVEGETKTKENRVVSPVNLDPPFLPSGPPPTYDEVVAPTSPPPPSAKAI